MADIEARRLTNLAEVMQRLRPFLPQYLAEHGIDTEKNFRCINPKHEDKTPSMSCKQNPENAFCFSCGVTCDVFTAAHWLENKPIEGPNFINDNIIYLAEKFGVALQLGEMTEEDHYRYRTFRAYRDAAALIANPEFGDYTKFNEECKRRQWNLPHLAEHGVGTINYKIFRNSLKAMGYEPSFQDEIDLGRADIFNEDNMIFPVCDERGNPVGFAARNLIYSEEKDENGQPLRGSKYMNQRTTGLRCNIYQKGKRLYELHTARDYTPPLYIFEGYADVLTAQQAGLLNCAGIGGTAFTSQHVETLKELNIYHIVLCLDGDKAGQSRTESLLDKFLCGQKSLNIEVVNLPAELDPDDFIRAKGLEEFLKLKKWAAFEWRLNRYSDESDPEEICKIMIPLIVNEPNHITQDKYCSQLSLFTGIEKRILEAELDRLQNQKEHEKRRERDAVLDHMFAEIKRNPGDATALLHECVAQVQAVEEKYDDKSFALESVVEFVEQQKSFEESLSGEFAGFHLSSIGLGGLGEYLNGNWREDVFMCFGGSANAGKTSILCQLGWEIASNEKNNATVIYHTIDDSAAQILPRFVCQGYGLPDLTMNQVRNPNYSLKNDAAGEAIVARRMMGYKSLLELVKNGRLVLRDMTNGTSFAYGESLIHYYQKKYPDRKIVYILDNLHKTPDFSGLEARMRFKALSNHMKAVATKHHVCIMATVEYTKLPPATVPTNDNIAETRAIIYDASFIGHLYNDLHEKGDLKAVCIHRRGEEIYPRIRLGIGKNKITDFKGRLFFDMYPASGLFRYIPVRVAEADILSRISSMRKESMENSDVVTVLERPYTPRQEREPVQESDHME